jgi:hypothetical protein
VVQSDKQRERRDDKPLDGPQPAPHRQRLHLVEFFFLEDRLRAGELVPALSLEFRDFQSLFGDESLLVELDERQKPDADSAKGLKADGPNGDALAPNG